MKLVIKVKALDVPEVKEFLLKNGYLFIRDMADTRSGEKFIIIDPAKKVVSTYNKINEEKVSALKVNLIGCIKMLSHTILVANYEMKFSMFESAITVYPESEVEDILVDFDTDKWWDIQEVAPKAPKAVKPKKEADNEFPKGGELFDKKDAIGVITIDYSFCTDETSVREMFMDISLYSSENIEEFLSCPTNEVIVHMQGLCVGDDIYQEMISPELNKVLNMKRETVSSLMRFVGIKDKKGNTVWILMQKMLEYMDMSEEIFFACLNNLSSTNKVQYGIPGLDDYPKESMKIVKEKVGKTDYLFNFAQVLMMRNPLWNSTDKAWGNINGYEPRI